MKLKSSIGGTGVAGFFSSLIVFDADSSPLIRPFRGEGKPLMESIAILSFIEECDLSRIRYLFSITRFSEIESLA